MDRIMAVLTRESKYAERFCDYVNRKNLLSLMAVPFFSIEKCISYSKKHNIELLVSDLEFASGGYMSGKATSDDIYAKKRIYLSGNDASMYRLSEAPADNAFTADPSDTLTKYQSAENLLNEIISCRDNRVFLKAARSIGRRSEVIGIFSPLGRCGKTSFALTLCRIIGRSHKVLYMNLDEFSCIYELFGIRAEEGISEAIYDLERGKLNSSRIKSLTLRSLDIDWLPPVTSQEDYGMISGQDYVSLVNEILKQSDYEYIVIDMDRYTGQADIIMDICDRVFIPTVDEGISSKKAAGFAEFMERTKEKGWLERIRYIDMPEVKSRGTFSEYLDNLCYGIMGDIVRELGLED